MIAGPRPYPAMKDSGVSWLGEVPEHWEVCRLRGLLTRNDSGVWGDDFDASGTVVLRSTEQTVDGGWHIVNPAKIRLAPAQRNAALLALGDLVLTKSSGSPTHIGKTSQVSSDVAALDCCFSNFMQRLRPGRNVDSRFLWRLLNCPVGREQLISWSTTTTGLGNLNGTIIGECRFGLPPLAEQAAIVRFLDYADRRIRRYIRAKQKLIKLLEEQKQAIIHRAVIRGLDPNVRLKPSGVEWQGDVPEHWDVVALKRVLRRLVDCEHKTAPIVERSDYRVVRTAAVRNGLIRWSGTYCTSPEAFQNWTQRGVPEPGDVIFTREAPAGEACLVPESAKLCLGQRTVLMKVRGEKYDGQFLVHMIYAGPPRIRIQLASQGSTVGHFNMDDIGWMKVLVPPLAEQREIVGAVARDTASLTQAGERAEREIDLLREYRTRLIADVVTGKLDAREAAARLPEEGEAPEPLDEVEAEPEAGDAGDDEALPDEAEA